MKYPLTPEELRARTEITGAALRLEERSASRELREGSATTEQAIHHRSMRAKHIFLILLLSLGLCFKATTLRAGEDSVTTLMSKIMKDVSGKEGRLIKVEYPPGGSTPSHRHNAHAFVYVLEGSIVMQLKGEKQVTLTPGQTFYESSNDIHIVSRNASNTESAKFVVFLVTAKGAPVLIPVK